MTKIIKKFGIGKDLLNDTRENITTTIGYAGAYFREIFFRLAYKLISHSYHHTVCTKVESNSFCLVLTSS